MLLEIRLVSDKTPRDGKLEVSPEVADSLKALGDDLPLSTPAGDSRAEVRSMECTCGKRGNERHIHYFVVSPLFKDLVAGTEVRLEIDDLGRLIVARVD